MPDVELLTARVDRLDRRMEAVEKRLDGIDTRLRGVETTLASISGRLDLIVSQMPRWYQAPVSAGALLARLLAAIAFASHFHLIHS